jgi:hypothetical protein
MGESVTAASRRRKVDDVTALLARAYGPAADDDAADRAFGLDPTAPAVRRPVELDPEDTF